MDVLLLLALAIGLIYFLFSAARWAFKEDSRIPRSGRKSRRRRPKTPAEKAIDDAFFAIIRPIWKRPTDDQDPG